MHQRQEATPSDRGGVPGADAGGDAGVTVLRVLVNRSNGACLHATPEVP